MKLTLTFDRDELGSRPTVIRVYDGRNSVAHEIDGSSENPSITVETNGNIRLSRDFTREPLKGAGASGVTLAHQDRR